MFEIGFIREMQHQAFKESKDQLAIDRQEITKILEENKEVKGNVGQLETEMDKLHEKVSRFRHFCMTMYKLR